MAEFSHTGKQVLRQGEHFADAVDPQAAEAIADALNQGHLLIWVQEVSAKLDCLTEYLVAEEVEDDVALDDEACPSCLNYRLEQLGLDLIHCKNCQWEGTRDEVRQANAKKGE